MFKKDSKKFFSKRKIGTALLILVGIALTFLICFTSYNEDKPLIWIERLYYSVQIVTGLYVVIGAVIGVWQYYISTKSEVIKNESDKVKQAVDLAGYYKDNIIPAFSSVRYVYDRIGALDIIKKIDKEKMVNFDFEELEQNLNNDQISKLKDSIKSSEFIKAVCEANFLYNLDLKYSFISENPLSDSNGNTEPNFDVLLLISLQQFMLNRMTKLLNDLEYFSMYFTYNIADESVVFQSLHQSFLNIVETMYYYISHNNIEPTQKFYVNVIELYRKWKEKNIKNQHNIDLAKQVYNSQVRNPSKGTVPKNLNTK